MYTDDNGIVRFEESDNVSPLHTALNTALQSVSTEFDVHTHDRLVGNGATLVMNDSQVQQQRLEYRNEVPGDSTGVYVYSGGNGSANVYLSTSNATGQLILVNNGTMRLDATGTNNQRASLAIDTKEHNLPFSWRAQNNESIPIPRVAAGNVPVVVPSGQTERSVTVTFPTGRFTVRPIVALATHSTAATLVNYSVTAVTTTSCSINVHRTSTAETLVDWIAVQV